MMPIGSSEPGRIVLASRSQNVRNTPPRREENKKRCLWSGPISKRTQWGTIKPTNPMIPLTDTEEEARRVERTKKIFLVRFTGQPRDRAVSSPMTRRFMSLASQEQIKKHRMN